MNESKLGWHFLRNNCGITGAGLGISTADTVGAVIELIEKGYDSKVGKHFYKIYLEQEF